MGIQRFSLQEREAIKHAIQAAENKTSGEIRVFVEEHCKEDTLDRASYHFERLGMHKTSLRNGVLIYLATADHKFAIIGDAGINTVTGSDFWNLAKEEMLIHFKQNNLAQGIITGIHKVGDALKKHFPYSDNDKNELPDDIAHA